MSMPAEFEYFHISAHTKATAFRRRLLEEVLALCSLKQLMCKTERIYGLEEHSGLCQLRRQHVILMASSLPLASSYLQMLWLAADHWLCCVLEN